MIEGRYYDGRTARAHAVTLRLDGSRLLVEGEGIELRFAAGELRPQERLGRAARRLDLPGGAHCEVGDHLGFEALLHALGFRPRWVERAQRSLPWVAASLVLLIAASLAFYRWGLPWVTEKTAEHVSPELATALSERTLKLLDDRYLEASELPNTRRRELEARARQLLGGETQLVFRKSERLGANALALPDGQIVLLDGLVALAENDEQLLAVLAHEEGHVVHRHGLKLAIRNTVAATLAAWWFGDISQLLVIVPTVLLHTQFSRELETEADAYAASRLRERGIAPTRLAEMLRKLSEQHGHENGAERWMRYLSTHPGVEERIAVIEGRALSAD